MRYGFSLLFLFFAICANTQEVSNITDSANQYSKDTVGLFEKVDIDAAYPGGETAWKKYLEKNFRVLGVTDAVLDELPKK